MLRNLFQERRRSIAVHRLTEADRFAEAAFDRFVRTAASAFVAPMAALSLIRGDSQIIRASHGMPLGCLPRDHGFCSSALDGPAVLECCDPLGDPRFAHLPGVRGELHVRYYIGVPLRLSSGIDVGVLCVADTVDRPPASDDQKAYLRSLARQASVALESRREPWGGAA